MDRKRTKTISFKARVIALMLMCWVLPLVMIAGVNVNYMTSDRLQNQISKEVERLRFADHTTAQQLEQVVEASREASYDKVLIPSYELYRQGGQSQYEFMSTCYNYIRESYARDDRVLMATLWFREDPNRLYCSTYNTGEGATYAAVSRYWKRDHDLIDQVSQHLDTKVTFVSCEDELYLVRNLLDPDYNNVATLVLLVNQDNCFQGYEVLPVDAAITLQLDDCTVCLRGERVSREETGIDRLDSTAGYSWDRNCLRLFHESRSGSHTLTTLIRYGEDSGFALFHGMDTFFALMALCLLPLIWMLLSVFYKHVTTPIQNMMRGAEEIEGGNLGYQLDYQPRSTEFRYLADSFNTMSKRLEYQFQHIYEEELALRDAKIKALQSHINPHFMNNTLEIINWEARMAGNDKVSEMIEALSTLMNAGMDRQMRPVIPLSEEMIYVDAYLHIVKERFGSRLTIINEFPEDIMECMVPRLILQPVIENAIDHGVARSGRGTVILYGYREGDFLYLEIMNEGVMTEEDIAKAARLLSPDYDSSRESSGSIGIANVDQRLRIIYGEGSGLSLERMDEAHVRTRLTIRVQPKGAACRETGPKDLGNKPRPDNK